MTQFRISKGKSKLHTTLTNSYQRGLLLWLIMTFYTQITCFIGDISNLSHLIAVIMNYLVHKELTMYNV